MTKSAWRTLQLGELGDIAGGGTPSTKVAEYWDGTIPWLTPSEVGRTPGLYVAATERTISPIGLERSSASLMPSGSVLVTSRATIGEVVINSVPMATNQGFINVVCDPAVVLSEYLAFWIRLNRGTLENRASGSTFVEISKSSFKSIPIDLPTIPTQQTIVNILNTVVSALDVRRHELALESERKAALMHHLFTHGTRGEGRKQRSTMFGDVPDDWIEMRLDDGARVQSGATMGRRFNGGRTVKRPYLRVANVQDGFLDLTEMKEIEVLETEVDRYRLQSGDVVLTEGGDFDKLGRGYLWRDEVPDCLHQNHIFAVRARREIVTPEFLAYLIQSHYGKAYFLSVAHRTTNLASINSTKLKAFPVVGPDMNEQDEIVGVLAACDAKIGAVGRELTTCGELFRALLGDLMSGRRRIN